MLIAEVACWFVTFDVELSTRKLKWYVFGYSTINLMIQSSSLAESACIESNVDQ